MNLVNRAGPGHVALESTLIIHGVPKGEGRALAAALADEIRDAGASPALVGVVAGTPTVGLTDAELDLLLDAHSVPKANTANLGVLAHAGSHAATTVSATMELAAAAGIRVFATGGLGGLHHNFAQHPDISSDLAAFTRFPVAVVTSGVKSLLNVEGTRELLESLGIPVLGFGTDRFPAFYLRESRAGVDARFDDVTALASFVRSELARTRRGIVIANPIPPDAEIPPDDWDRWIAQAHSAEGDALGRDVTPRTLAAVHFLSHGRTLAANIALARSNAALAARLARAMGES